MAEWKIAKKGRPLVQWHWRRRPYVSLNRRGEIAINEAAWEEIGCVWNVALYWNARKKHLGVKCVRWDDLYRFPVRTYGRGRRMRIIRGGRLLKQFGIEIGQTLRFNDIRSVTFRGEPMLVLQLGNGQRSGG